MSTRVVVVGAGPAGRAVASRLLHHGVRVTVVDPAPEATWTPTYGLWEDELPSWLDPGVVAARLPDAPAVGRSGRRFSLSRTYAVLSTKGLQQALDIGGARVLAGRAVRTHQGAVLLADGEEVRGDVVIDASGGGRAPGPGGRRGAALPAAQTAYGVVVPASALPSSVGRPVPSGMPSGMAPPGPSAVASPGVPRASAMASAMAPQGVPLTFMDWRDDHGEDGWPTFLYAVPLDAERVLLEETALARRPGLPLSVLQRRLRARLAARGLDLHDLERDGGDLEVERVAFRVDRPRRRGAGRLVPFGAAAPVMHPATGYSVGASLSLADEVAAAIAGGGSADAAEAARRVIWPAGAVAVDHLRRRGLEAVLALPHDGVADFFELFFELDPVHQRAYLSERQRPEAVASAMWALFRAADGPLRRHLARWGAGLGAAAAAEAS